MKRNYIATVRPQDWQRLREALSVLGKQTGDFISINRFFTAVFKQSPSDLDRFASLKAKSHDSLMPVNLYLSEENRQAYNEWRKRNNLKHWQAISILAHLNFLSNLKIN